MLLGCDVQLSQFLSPRPPPPLVTWWCSTAHFRPGDHSADSCPVLGGMVINRGHNMSHQKLNPQQGCTELCGKDVSTIETCWVLAAKGWSKKEWLRDLFNASATGRVPYTLRLGICGATLTAMVSVIDYVSRHGIITIVMSRVPVVRLRVCFPGKRRERNPMNFLGCPTSSVSLLTGGHLPRSARRQVRGPRTP